MCNFVFFIALSIAEITTTTPATYQPLSASPSGYDSCYKDLALQLKSTTSSDSSIKSCPGSENEPVEIIMYGEQHGTPTALALNDVLEHGASASGLIYFSEHAAHRPLSGRSDDAFSNGLVPDSGLTQYARLRMFEELADAFYNLSDSAKMERYESMTFDLVLAIKKWPSLWSKVKSKLVSQATPDAKQLYAEIDAFPQNPQNIKAINFSKNHENLKTINLEMRKSIEAQLLSQPEYARFRVEGLRQFALGPVREIIWAEEIKRSFCALKKHGKPVWISVGQGHSRGLSCALQVALGSRVRIRTVSDSGVDSLLKNWASRFVESDRAKETKERTAALLRRWGYNISASDIEVSTGKWLEDSPFEPYDSVTMQLPQKDIAGKTLDFTNQQRELFTKELYSIGLTMTGSLFGRYVLGPRNIDDFATTEIP